MSDQVFLFNPSMRVRYGSLLKANIGSVALIYRDAPFAFSTNPKNQVGVPD